MSGTLVDGSSRLDAAVRKVAVESGFRVVAYEDVVSKGNGSRKRALDRLKPGFLGDASEKEAFNDLGILGPRDLVVASVGRPGAFLSATAGATRSLYFLHTYPHGWKHRLLGRRIMPGLVSDTTTIVTGSKFAARRVADQWGLDARMGQIRTIPYTVGQVPNREVSRPPLRLVLTVAQVEPYKGPREWVGAAEIALSKPGMDDVQFVWVGDGSLIDECRAAVSTELRGRIQFVGFMEDVAPYFAAATVYLQLSTVENLSLSVLDALRYGLPTILTRVGGMPEQTIDGVSGILVAPGDVQGAADATVWMLSSDDRVANMSEGARNLYLTRFGPQVWEQHMDLLHAEALAS